MTDDTILLIAPTGIPARMLREMAAAAGRSPHIVVLDAGLRDYPDTIVGLGGQVIIDDPFITPDARAGKSDLLNTDLAEVELRLLAHELEENPFFEEAQRLRREYICIDEQPMPEMPFFDRTKPHHGQPRSLKETRRAQRKGGKRR